MFEVYFFFHFQADYLTQFFKRHAELIETKYRSHLGRTNTSAGINTVDVWIHTLTSAANTAVTFSVFLTRSRGEQK